MNHIVKSNWKSKSIFEHETPGGTLQTSMAEDGGLGPKALMLDALLGCTGIDVVSIIQKMRLNVDDITLSAEASLTKEHPKIYENVHVIFHFFGDNLDKEKLEKAVNLSSEKYCGVMEMFRRFAKITIEIRYN